MKIYYVKTQYSHYMPTDVLITLWTEAVSGRISYE